jgi:predicted benzoate:H+ symporter BenE
MVDPRAEAGSRRSSERPAGQPLTPSGSRRFVWGWGEVSGALGDLGTFLPHVLGAIAVVGLAPSGVLTGFGLLYLASGLLYGLPIAVQPMKAASAAMLTQGMTPGQVAGAGLVIGGFFTLVGLTGLIGWLARVTPAAVVAGIQLGLGMALGILGLRLIEHQPVIGLSTGLVLLLLLGQPRLPAALVGLAWSIGLASALGQLPPVPPVTLGLHLPPLVLPSLDDLLRGTELAVLPQIPLTLTNAIIVTSVVARELFPDAGQRVTVKKLALTNGLGNLLTAPFGGYPMCHGSSGLAGHYRFGARSATAPLLIGVSFLALGLLLGDGAVALLGLVPEAALGALLLFSGLELALAARVERFARQGPELLIILLVATLAVASNAALAFGLGLLVAWGARRGWVRW